MKNRDDRAGIAIGEVVVSDPARASNV